MKDGIELRRRVRTVPIDPPSPLLPITPVIGSKGPGALEVRYPSNPITRTPSRSSGTASLIGLTPTLFAHSGSYLKPAIAIQRNTAGSTKDLNSHRGDRQRRQPRVGRDSGRPPPPFDLRSAPPRLAGQAAVNLRPNLNRRPALPSRLLMPPVNS